MKQLPTSGRLPKGPSGGAQVMWFRATGVTWRAGEVVEGRAPDLRGESFPIELKPHRYCYKRFSTPVRRAQVKWFRATGVTWRAGEIVEVLEERGEWAKTAGGKCAERLPPDSRFYQGENEVLI